MRIYKIMLLLAIIINPVCAIDKVKVLEIIKAAKSHKRVKVVARSKKSNAVVSSTSREKIKMQKPNNLPYGSLPALLPTSEILKRHLESIPRKLNHSTKIKPRSSVNLPNSYAKSIEF